MSTSVHSTFAGPAQLVRFYYRPRVEAFLEHTLKRFGRQETMAGDLQLESIYHKIQQAWAK